MKSHHLQLSICCFVTCFAAMAAVASEEEQNGYFPEKNPPFVKNKSDDAKDMLISNESYLLTSPTTEWIFHKTADDSHPNGHEQQIMWLMNRARYNPAQEGNWLSSSTDPDVAGGRSDFGVDLTKLKNEFATLAAKPPAAFDNRLYAAAYAHSSDLIARDAQDHNQQFNRITAAGFHYSGARGSVFSYADSGLNAHAAWNIDWGPDSPDDGDGMQSGRGHRMATMSSDGSYTNVGIAAINETNTSTRVGEYVTTGNYCQASTAYADHYNIFIVGTVWSDSNGNGQYDPWEGKGNVQVMPDKGTYYAVTGDSGGYAVPILTSGTYNVTFSGSALSSSQLRTVSVNGASVLLDIETGSIVNIYTVTPSAGAGGTISPNMPQTVNHGSTTSFIITPNTNYTVKSVSGCGGNLNGSTFTTAPVIANCMVTASFTLNSSPWTNGQAATLVLGQPGFDINGSGAGADRMGFPTTVAVDPTTDKVFVADKGNHRVLRFASSAALANGIEAEAVLGQPDFFTTSEGLAANKMNLPSGIAVDAGGHLWVADGANERVLRFDNAAVKASGANADGVLGQGNFTSNTEVAAQNSMNLPVNLVVDAAGRLWVSDHSNNRVLRFDNAAAKVNGANADGVLGQTNFTSLAKATTRNGMYYPVGLALTPTGVLFVADMANERVLRFDNAAAKVNGANADAVLGQSDFTSNARGAGQNGMDTPMGLSCDNAGRLYVADYWNSRVLIFNNAAAIGNGANADNVLGQSDFTTNTPNEGGVSASTLSNPTGVFADKTTGVLWVADHFNSRVLRYGGAASTRIALPAVYQLLMKQN